MQWSIPAETSKKPISFDSTEVTLAPPRAASPPEVVLRRTAATAPWTYAELDRNQRELAHLVRESQHPGAILMSELEPVITLGKRTAPTDLIWNEAQFSRAGVELLPVDRGGQATWHGPGQWVLFPVMTLSQFTGDARGVRRAVDRLLHAAKETARAFGVEAQIREAPATGLWTPRGKLASVGLRVDQGVILHGLSFNVFRSSTSFQGLRPCGADAQVDYLIPGSSDDSDRSAVFERVGQELIRQLEASNFTQ